MMRTWIIAACCVFIGSLLLAQTTPVLTELQTFKEKGDAIVENGWFQGVAFSPDGKIIAVCTHTGYLLVWDLADGKKLKTKKIAKSKHLSLMSLTFTPDSKKLAFRKGNSDIAFWSLELEQEVQAFQFPNALHYMCITQDGKFLIGAGQGEYTNESRVVIWNLETGAKVREIKSKKMISGIAVSPDGTKLACTCGRGVPIFDMATGEELDRFEEKEPARSVAFSPDGKMLAFITIPSNAQQSAIFNLWDMTTNKSIGQWTGASRNIEHIVFSPDGVLVAAKAERNFYVYHVASNKQASIEMRDLESIAFSTDSKVLAVAGKVDKKTCVVLWKIELK